MMGMVAMYDKAPNNMEQVRWYGGRYGEMFGDATGAGDRNRHAEPRSAEPCTVAPGRPRPRPPGVAPCNVTFPTWIFSRDTLLPTMW